MIPRRLNRKREIEQSYISYCKFIIDYYGQVFFKQFLLLIEDILNKRNELNSCFELSHHRTCCSTILKHRMVVHRKSKVVCIHKTKLPELQDELIYANTSYDKSCFNHTYNEYMPMRSSLLRVTAFISTLSGYTTCRFGQLQDFICYASLFSRNLIFSLCMQS